MSIAPVDRAAILVVAAGDVPAQAWRNGGGQTRELLAWPSGEAWRVRVSRADIDRDGPFSAFPQVDRWFAVLQGAGVALQWPHGERSLRTGDDAVHFDGAAAPGCRLLDGPTQDLNLMLRAAAGVLQRWQAGQPWDAGFSQCGLYTTVEGQWQCGQLLRDLPAHSLLWTWSGPPGAWTFTPKHVQPPGAAWWLGVTLQD